MELLNLITIFGAAEQPEGIAALGIDPLAILAQGFTFLVLFWVIKKFALDKIVQTLEVRRKTIDDGVRLGREMEAAKEQLSDRITKELQKARQESDNIIAASREEAGAIINEAQNTAQRKADDLLRDARSKIDEDIQAARRGLEKEIRELIAEATAVIAEEKIDATKDASLIDRALARAKGI